MNRAQALFNSTLGRLGNVFVETAYPLLPRYSGDRRQYTRQATEFAQSILLVMIPGTFYLGLEGAAISRVLYGEKWVDADPLIWPGALLGLGLAMLTVSTSILLAVNRLRACFLLSVMSAALGAPLVTLAWVTQNLVFYAWSLAVGQLVAGLIAFATAASLFNRGWLRTVLVPPVASSVFAAGLALVAHDTVGQGPLWIHLSLSLALYVLATLLILRAFFLDAFAILMSRFPGGSRMQDWLGPRPARVLSNDS